MKPIGILIREELERQERSISWFARDHDFFTDLSEQLQQHEAPRITR